MTLAPYIHAMGRGPGRARNLSQAEAEQAMTLILQGQADPHAVGALLMLMRYRGEIPAEIAGFVQALRATLPEMPQVDLDWPSYAAGRTRGLPWFLLSARLVASTGARVLLHGWNSHQSDGADVRGALNAAGITQANSLSDLAHVLDQHAIAYLPLEILSPRALELLNLRQVLGLRSCVNTVLRVLNPAGAGAAVQGVFHPPYRGLQQAAAHLLGQRDLCILKGGGGEFERNPTKDVQVFRLVGGQALETTLPALLPEPRRLPGADYPLSALQDLWSGGTCDPYLEQLVTGTAAAALMALGHAPDAAHTLATAHWAQRDCLIST
ncbi:glycosyl transferase family protein [Roseinatronobacter alkalisoli]|uniref:Glycosyl transferase family protein n=1 Tax=Roseinatronobacter alkalisoli TaxID=3028235 RepID=A0ABT5TBS3_9RHOB|nr:glycosyl transferase family protein [Roseinatronobacter sp. HJB301]MDD7972583.1 glycosyl transferase family protein [Roseinatronobacter sp. HJB301]